MAKPDKEQVISIKGIGGIGKTTFVKALAQAVSSQFRLILWAELGEQWRVDAELRIMQTWADLANREFTSDISTDRMAIETRRALTKLVSQDTKPILLIIDDVWPETVRSVRLLREAAPLGTQVVITTRSEDVAAALNSQSFLLDKMNPSDGSSLLAAIVNHPAAKKDLLVELSALLGGHALSLELIGRYLRRNFQPQRLLKLIAELRQGLENGSSFKELRLDTGDSKVESFSVSLNQTLNALSPRRQGQFRALGVMPSELPFRSSHVMAIWKEDDWQGLDDLVAEGLLTPVSDKEDQYTQHRLLRAYARALLRSTDHLSETQELHWNYIIKIAQDTFGKPLEYWEQSRDDIPQIHAIGNELVGLIIDSNNHPKIDDLLRAFSEHGNLVSSPQAMGKFDAFLKAVRAYILERYIGVEGLRWLLAGLAISRTKQDLNGIAAVSSLLGLWHEHHGNKREALRYHTLSLETDKSLGNQTGQATTLNNIGAIHFTVGEYHDAFECFEEALSLSYRTDDISTRANALSSIGRLFHALGDSEQALKYFREAIDLFQRTGDEGHEAITLTNMGLAYQRLNKLNASLGCYHKALKINDKSGDSYAKAATLNNMGLTYNALRKPQKALSFFQKALTLVTQVGNLEGEAKTHGNIATMLWQQGETETAKQQMQIASRILHDLDLDASDEDFMLKEWNKVIR